MQELKEFIRDCIIRQVQTTDAGKKLTAYDAEAVDSLVKNIVGNLTLALVGYELDLKEELQG